MQREIHSAPDFDEPGQCLVVFPGIRRCGMEDPQIGKGNEL